jgi:hypothetical protein
MSPSGADRVTESDIGMVDPASPDAAQMELPAAVVVVDPVR